MHRYTRYLEIKAIGFGVGLDLASEAEKVWIVAPGSGGGAMLRRAVLHRGGEDRGGSWLDAS